MRNPKTAEERAGEAMRIAQQLEATGLPFDHPRVQQLRAALRDFAEAGVGFSGVLKMPESRLAMVVKLSCQRHIDSGVQITRLA